MNRLTVRGPAAELERFAVKAASGMTPERAAAAAELLATDDAARAEITAGLSDNSTPMTFAGHMPEPTSYPTSDGWYDWRVRHWGTKWDASDVHLEHLADPHPGLRYEFSTPWGPPAGWFEAVAAQHRDLTFEMLWNEEQCIAGAFFAEGGVLRGEDCADEDLRSVYGWEDAPYVASDYTEEDLDFDEPLAEEFTSVHAPSAQAEPQTPASPPPAASAAPPVVAGSGCCVEV